MTNGDGMHGGSQSRNDSFIQEISFPFLVRISAGRRTDTSSCAAGSGRIQDATSASRYILSPDPAAGIAPLPAVTSPPSAVASAG